MTDKEKLAKINSCITSTALALIIIGMGDTKDFDALFHVFTDTITEIKGIIKND